MNLYENLYEFLLWSTKDILKKVGNQRVDGSHDLHSIFFPLLISIKQKKEHFWVNYPFKARFHIERA